MKKSLHHPLSLIQAALAALTNRWLTPGIERWCLAAAATSVASFQPIMAAPVDIQGQLTQIASHNSATNLSSVVRHRDRVYLAISRSNASSNTYYYDLTTGKLVNDGESQLEENDGGQIKYGNYFTTGGDLAGDLGNSNAIYIREYDRFYPIVPPGAAGHRATQGIFDGKIFANHLEIHRDNQGKAKLKPVAYPGGIFSSDYGKSWVKDFNLAGKNGFKTKIRTFNGLGDPVETAISSFFQFKGSFFAMANGTGALPLFVNGIPNQAEEGENFLMRYTGNQAEPWELAVNNHRDIGFRGFNRAFSRSELLVNAEFTEFKDYLFMEERGTLYRFETEEVPSLENEGETYFRPKAGGVEVWNSNLKPNSNESRLYGGFQNGTGMIKRHGILYRIEFRNTSATQQDRVIVRSTDGVNWEDIITINVGASGSTLASWRGSPTSSIKSHRFDWDVNGDLYLGSSDRKLYRVPASVLGTAAHSGAFNSAPVAVNDSFTSPEGTLFVERALNGMLVNDSDPDGDAHYSELVTGPSHGTIELRYNGTFRYIPTPGFTGVDTFTYRVTDEFAYSAPATVTINVTGLNPPPTAITLSGERQSIDTTADGTVIGALSTADPSTHDIATYTIRNPEVPFKIVDGNLVTAFSPVANLQGSYTIQVRSTDTAGSFVDAEFTIKVFAFGNGAIASAGEELTYSYDARSGKLDPFALYTGRPEARSNGRSSKDYLKPRNSPVEPFTVRYDFAAVDGRLFNAATIRSNVERFTTKTGQSVVLKYSFDGETYTQLFDTAVSRSSTDTIPGISGKGFVSLIWEYNPGSGAHEDFALFSSNSSAPGMVFSATTTAAGTNATPSDIALTPNRILENSLPDAVVGQLSTVDADNRFAHRYSLVGGDTASFTISGDRLLSVGSFDFETKSSYSVTIRTSDLLGRNFQKTISVGVDDASEGGNTVRDSSGNIILAGEASTYGSGQDGQNSLPTNVVVNGAGSLATISGNVWKRFPLSYAVTPDTVLQFTVSGTETGELVGIALDNDNNSLNTGPASSKRAFMIGGSDTSALDWASRVDPAYVANAPAQTYTIPVGTFFTGSVVNLGLIGDDDANGSTSISFRNIRIYEAGSLQGYVALSAAFDWGSTPLADRSPAADANSNGIENLLEFAFNLSPTAPGGPKTLTPGTGTSGMPAVSVVTPETPMLQIEYLRRKTSGLTYTVKFSDDLVTWDDAVATPTVTAIDADWDRCVMPDTAGADRPKRFAKVVVFAAP